MGETRQFCTFFLADLYFGIEVHRVQEVIRAQAMTRVPLAQPAIRGLINLRGQIVTAIDLRERLRLPPVGDGREPMNVVVRTAEGAVSLLVDEIGDVLETRAEQHEDPPRTLSPWARELITGVYLLEDRLLLVLDTGKTLNLEASGAC